MLVLMLKKPFGAILREYILEDYLVCGVGG